MDLGSRIQRLHYRQCPSSAGYKRELVLDGRLPARTGFYGP